MLQYIFESRGESRHFLPYRLELKSWHLLEDEPIISGLEEHESGLKYPTSAFLN